MDHTYYIGKELGKCKIDSLLGSGGMAWVYLAHHKDLKLNRAIKVLKPIDSSFDIKKKDLLLERFLREGQLSACLDHKNIIKVHDVGTIDKETYFMEMEYLEGQTLTQLIRNKNTNKEEIPIKIIACIANILADTLNYAHNTKFMFAGNETTGLIHRDLKPDNIFINKSGQLKILDFGIAKLADMSLTTSTEARNVTGTLSYMSPEQINGSELTKTSDIFSIGVVLYELITGKHPFLTDKMQTTVMNICNGKYTKLS